MSASAPESVRLVTVALVPVSDEAGGDGLLLVAGHGEREPALPEAQLSAADASWQDALVRAVREQTGLSVTFGAHLSTVSGRDGRLLVFGETSPVRAETVLRAGQASGLTVVRRAQTDLAPASAEHAQVIARWFAGRLPRDRGTAADRRCAVTGRRAADAEALAATDLATAVRAVYELASQHADFTADQYARTLLARTLAMLAADQRARWGERGSDLLLTFLWQLPREDLPVDELFACTARWACSHATREPAACFAQPHLRRARAWMDKVALAHGLGRVMAPVHTADPVGVVRSVLGIGRYGRLESKLRGETAAILPQLDESQWELAYVAVGARKPAALTPAGLDPDELLDGFADVLARSRRLAAR